MTTFQAKAFMLFVFATFLIALYNSGSRAANWYIQYERVSAELARERKANNLLISELDEARHDRKVCNEVKGYLIGNAEKLAIKRRELAACKRKILTLPKQSAIIKQEAAHD